MMLSFLCKISSNVFTFFSCDPSSSHQPLRFCRQHPPKNSRRSSLSLSSTCPPLETSSSACLAFSAVCRGGTATPSPGPGGRWAGWHGGTDSATGTASQRPLHPAGCHRHQTRQRATTTAVSGALSPHPPPPSSCATGRAPLPEPHLPRFQDV